MSFEVFVKYGKNWARRGEIVANDSTQAAKEAAYILSRCTIGVRPANSNVDLIVHKFDTVPSLD